jgi:hypothetical protein
MRLLVIRKLQPIERPAGFLAIVTEPHCDQGRDFPATGLHLAGRRSVMTLTDRGGNEPLISP